MSAKSAAEMSRSSSKSAAPAAAAAASAAAAGPEAAAAAAAEGWAGAAGVAPRAGSPPPEPSSGGEGADEAPPAACVSCCAAELLPSRTSSSLPGQASVAAEVLGAAAGPGAQARRRLLRRPQQSQAQALQANDEAASGISLSTTAPPRSRLHFMLSFKAQSSQIDCCRSCYYGWVARYNRVCSIFWMAVRCRQCIGNRAATCGITASWRIGCGQCRIGCRGGRSGSGSDARLRLPWRHAERHQLPIAEVLQHLQVVRWIQWAALVALEASASPITVSGYESGNEISRCPQCETCAAHTGQVDGHVNSSFHALFEVH